MGLTVGFDDPMSLTVGFDDPVSLTVGFDDPMSLAVGAPRAFVRPRTVEKYLWSHCEI